MTHARPTALALAAALLTSACATTTTTTHTWGDQPYGDAYAQQDWARYGHVESIRETVQRQQGNPAGGAVAGAIIGGLLGSTLGGHWAYDRWGRAYHEGSGVGAAVGAIGGAAVGAAASQGGAEYRSYEVFVLYDDGGRESYVYQGYPPFQPGEPVVLTPQGLAHQ
jgi:outer membrane lipoprotein SlyB